MKKEIPKAYNPQEVEDIIYKKWEESGMFNPDNLELTEEQKSDKNNRFVISMPPPNATGVLHLGHASMLAYQDLMVRYNRMKGKNALWLPGTDHASIATQTKVEKIIAEKGQTKYDLGREKFLERVNEYVENSQSTIKNQTRKMGSSCDWSRERYTLDDGLSRAVREVFVKMYNDKLIYRGDRIVNWCPRCESTLADDEVEHKDQKANLYYFKYTKDFPITIATTRPETKLGDTAVAVNPKDERYQKYIGQVYSIDLGNGVHKIKIIADREVEMEFGTGALGVTPAHSMTDWEMAEKNDLEKIKIIGEDGKMNSNAGAGYEGLTVLEAREKFVQYLEENKLIEKVEEVDQALSVCYRCDASIEPLPSKQWFVAVDKKITIEGNQYFQNKSLKEVALEVVNKAEEKNKDKIEIIPERFSKTYHNWMENLHDWCISRQLWFGHRIPVWYRKESRITNQESRTNFVFLRGFLRTADVKDPLGWLNEKLSDKDNFYEELPSSDKPNLQEQMDFVMDNAKINENTTIVAHSVGCILAMKLVEKNDLKIKKLVLIASPMQTQKTVDGKKRKEAKNYGDGKFDFDKIKKLVDETVVIRDINDHVVLPEEPKIIAEKLGARLVEIEAPVKHFNCDECQEVLNEIENQEIQEVYVGIETLEEKYNKAVLLHAWGSGPEEAFFPWLKREFESRGIEVIVPVLPNPENPDFDKWLKEFNKIETDEKTIVVGRSLGSTLALGAASRGKKFGNLVAVCTPLENAEIPEFFEQMGEINFEKIQNNIEQYSVLHSSNDPYIKLEISEKLAKELGAELIVVENADHFSGESYKEILKACNVWIQDSDTLDTWFSSGLWTFSTLLNQDHEKYKTFEEWVENSSDLKKFHPTSVMETGYDILFFWIARMILMTTYTLGEVPFENVYLHGMVRDKQGKKMSKSLGNGIDPIEMIEKYGTDALRLSMIIGSSPGNDLKLYEEKIEGYRNFVNKLWNVSRYILTSFEIEKNENQIDKKNLTFSDKWILREMEKLINEVSEDLENYRFSQAGEKLKEFTWDKLADWYLETSKFEKDGDKKAILSKILQDLLKLSHPFIPFVTEQIWQEMGKEKLLMIEKWPNKDNYTDILGVNQSEEYVINKVHGIIGKIRKARIENGVDLSRKIKAVIYAGKDYELIKNEGILIKNLQTGIDEIKIKESGEKIENEVNLSEQGIEIYLIGMIDKEKEKERIEKEIEETEKYIKQIKGKFDNEQFIQNAPVEIVEKEKEKLLESDNKLKGLKEKLCSLL